MPPCSSSRRSAAGWTEQTPALLARLAAARDARDGPALVAAAHALSGSLRNFGLDRAAGRARAAETLARAGRVDEAIEEAAGLEEATRQGLHLLGAMFAPATSGGS